MAPVHLAAKSGHHAVVSYFLEKFKVDPSIRSRVRNFEDDDDFDNDDDCVDWVTNAL